MNKLIKKLIIMLNLLSIIVISTSCIGARELDTLAIVICIGLDIEDGKVVITNEVINPISGAASKNATTEEGSIFVQGRGDTILEAVANTRSTFNRELYYPHNRLIIFGEEFAKRGIGDYLDLFSRDNEARESSFMLVAEDAKAYDVMGVNGGLVKTSGMYLYDILRADKYNAKTRVINVSEFFKYYYILSTNPVIGKAKLIQHPQINKNRNESQIILLDVEGGTVFDVDKLKGYFTGEEMIGYNFVIDTLKTVTIAFETPEHLVESNEFIGRQGKKSSLKVFKSKTKKKVDIIDGKLHLTIDVVFRGGLGEVTQGLDISKYSILEEMEKACSEKAKSHIVMAIDKAQKEFGFDVFNIGELVHRKYPKLWEELSKDWSATFSDLDYTVNVETHINNVLFTNTPPNIKKGK